MGYVEKNLLSDERLLYKAKLHWMTYVGPIFLVFLGIGPDRKVERFPDSLDINMKPLSR